MDAFYAIDPVNGERVLCSARVNAEINEYLDTIQFIADRHTCATGKRMQHRKKLSKFIERGREDALSHRDIYEAFLKWRNENKEQPIIVQASQITP